MSILNANRLWGIICAVFITACSTGPVVIDDRYVFNDLESVDRFTNYTVSGWEVIDSQSLVIRTSPSTNYLLILNRKLPELRSVETIGLTSTGSSIHAGFDCVKVRIPHCGPEPITLVINSIYRLKGREDIQRARAQIRGDS
jgi:hypothetical protein